jgi:hypothetical protein
MVARRGRRVVDENVDGRRVGAMCGEILFVARIVGREEVVSTTTNATRASIIIHRRASRVGFSSATTGRRD